MSTKHKQDGPIHVVHLISGLWRGGAETMLVKLLGSLDSKRFRSSVIQLAPGGELRDSVRRTGAELYHLGMTRSAPGPRALLDLYRLTRKLNPDVLHGWMYHGNLAACWAQLALKPRAPMLWGIRQTLYDIRNEKRLTAAVIKFCALLSKRADCVSYNSHTSLAQHSALGYHAANAAVLNNGFDLQHFKRVPAEGLALRTQLGIDQAAPVVAHVSRWHPMKDHLTLLRAAKQLALRIPNIVFILAGRELDASNRELSRMVQHYDLGKRVFLLGDRSDIRPVYNACNLFVLNSAWGEGFPNVIGEALACEIPVVATDIGDCREVVDRFGRIVPPSQPDKLANAIHEFLRLEPQTLTELGAQARRSIQQRFALPSIARGYEEVYYQLLRIQSASSSKTPKYLSTAS